MGTTQQFFAALPSQHFFSVCNQIESDSKYRPNMTNGELLNIVRDEQGKPRHVPRRSESIIQRYTSQAQPAGYQVYQIKIALYGPVDGDEHTNVWHVDTTVALVVRKLDGRYSLHAREQVDMGNFNQPLTHLNIHNYLSSELPNQQDAGHIIAPNM